mgnify:CR=1 FL=1
MFACCCLIELFSLRRISLVWPHMILPKMESMQTAPSYWRRLPVSDRTNSYVMKMNTVLVWVEISENWTKFQSSSQSFFERCIRCLACTITPIRKLELILILHHVIRIRVVKYGFELSFEKKKRLMASIVYRLMLRMKGHEIMFEGFRIVLWKNIQNFYEEKESVHLVWFSHLCIVLHRNIV